MAKDELRSKEHEVKLSNQAIVEIAYMTKEIIEDIEGRQLTFEQANCYQSNYYTVVDMLKAVDPEYLSGRHGELFEYFSHESPVTKENNRLYKDAEAKRVAWKEALAKAQKEAQKIVDTGIPFESVKILGEDFCVEDGIAVQDNKIPF